MLGRWQRLRKRLVHSSCALGSQFYFLISSPGAVLHQALLSSDSQQYSIMMSTMAVVIWAVSSFMMMLSCLPGERAHNVGGSWFWRMKVTSFALPDLAPESAQDFSTVVSTFLLDSRFSIWEVCCSQ